MKNKVLQIIIAQLDFLVGDIDGNTTKVIDAAQQAHQSFKADLILFPELALTGYPPEDLLLRASLQLRIEKALLRLRQQLPPDLHVVVGYPRQLGDALFNSAGVIHNGELITEYHKQELPNFQVFDEKRYFQPGAGASVFTIKGVTTAITICEDIWHNGPMAQAKAAGARLMLNLNGSPFHQGKEQERVQLLQKRVAEGDMPIVYTNLVGGQDELVFDGGSCVMNATGELTFRAPAFREGLYPVLLQVENGEAVPQPQEITPDQSVEASVYNALVLGVKDYVNKNGFKGAVLGLSGGIDSALTLTVAVDALGADRVEAIMMPFRYTSQMSLEDAKAEADALGVSYKIRPIEPMYEAFMDALAEDFAGTARDTTEENLQARCRGVMLMAMSNKKRYIVLTTGNKSEMAVGYATLYGDMAGGFAVLKDIPKTLVFRLSEYRNTLNPANPPIPQRVIDRPPSAELAPDQLDQDSLPPYDILDAILERYVERDWSLETIVADGFERETVQKVIRLVDLSEYKRRQAAVGVRITTRGFGRDRRYPITCKWTAGE